MGQCGSRHRWQRLKPMEKLARVLLDHLDGILNYCRIKIPLGVVEAVNRNIKALLRRGRGYRDLNYLLLKAHRLVAPRPNSSCSGRRLECILLRILVQSPYIYP